MQRYWFDKHGKTTDIGKEKYICIDMRSEHSYSMSIVNKRGELKGIVTGDFTRVSAMFQRYTSVSLSLPDTSKFFNAYLEPCDGGGFYKQEGLSLFAKEGGTWKPAREKVRPTLYYYDSDGCPCDIGDAVEQYAITASGERYVLDKEGCILRQCPLELPNKRNFYTREMQPTTAAYALFRVIGDADTGMAAVYIRSMSNWVRHSTVPAFHLKQEVLTAGLSERKTSYRDEKGEPCDAEVAVYSVITKIPGILLHLYEGETLVKTGTPRDIQEYFDRVRLVKMVVSKPESPKPTPATSELKPDLKAYYTVDMVWDLCKDTTHIRRSKLAAALVIMCSRNRKQKNGPIFDTLLHDNLWQPIYIVDLNYSETEFRVDLDRMYVVRSLAEAQHINSNITQLPAPFRWANNPADLVWNPTIKLAPITQHQMEHVCMDNISRLPKELQSVEPAVLMLQIKQEIEKGTRIAACDVRYALPMYSAEHDSISMVLPVHVPLLYGNSLVACAVLCKTELGYRLCTLITTEMARTSISTIIDISSTWLKEEE